MILCTLLGEITESLCLVAHEAISQAEFQKSSLTIHLDSGGGDVTPGSSLAIRIRNSPIEVTTHALMEVSSIALLIFAAGHRRECSKYSEFMLHGISAEIELSNINTIANKLVTLKRNNQRMLHMLSEYGNLGSSFLKQKCDSGEDYFFGASEALKLGFVHEIYDK